jgi:hypothetical protein
MSPSPRAAASPADRVASIIRMQAILFDAAFPGEYEELLDFLEDRRGGKIERIVSILRAQEILLGSGSYLRGARAKRGAAEIPGLIAYLRSLTESERAPAFKAEVLPRNLGKTFAARRWGFPLFGDYRPSSLPDRGILLLYKSPDKGGTASVEAARLGPGDALSYAGPGLCLDSSGYWLSCDARPPDSPSPASFPGEKERRETFAFSRYLLSLDLSPIRRSYRGRMANPYEYEYPYLFFEGPASAANLARFLAELLSGILRVPLRDAERIAEAFSERMP